MTLEVIVIVLIIIFIIAIAMAIKFGLIKQSSEEHLGLVGRVSQLVSDLSSTSDLPAPGEISQDIALSSSHGDLPSAESAEQAATRPSVIKDHFPEYITRLVTIEPKAIGAGAFGKVFRGRYKSDGKPVVVKVQSGTEAYDPKLPRSEKSKTDLILNEISTYEKADGCGMAKLLHHTDDYGVNQEYYIMEYIGGLNLSSVIKNLRGEDRKYIPRVMDYWDGEQGFIEKVLNPIRSALKCMHARDVFHRDLKPANIMVRAENKTAVLIDLGLGCFIKGSCSLGAGTPIYKPPEVWKRLHEEEKLRRQVPGTNENLLRMDLSNYDPAHLDIWAFGITLFETLMLFDPVALPSPIAKKIRDLPIERRVAYYLDKYYGDWKRVGSFIKDCLSPDLSVRQDAWGNSLP